MEFICIYLRFISPACHVAATLARVSSAFSPPSASTCTWAPRLEGDHHHHHPHPLNNITIIIITNMINVYNVCTCTWAPRSESDHHHHHCDQDQHHPHTLIDIAIIIIINVYMGQGYIELFFFLEYPIK